MRIMQNAPCNYPAKPFIKWVGGKRQLLPVLVSKLPDFFDASNEITYIEPFVGGGAMFFFMLSNFKNIKRAVINDINSRLIDVYKVVRDAPEQLIALLKEFQSEYLMENEKNRKIIYLDKRREFNENKLTDIETAALLIFLNKTCFNGLYRENSKGEFNVPHGRYKNPVICDEKTIIADSLLLKNVEIYCNDFEDTESFAGSNTFVYLDPPYRPLCHTSNFNSYVDYPFDDSEQIRLKQYVDRLTDNGVYIMLSNSDGKSFDRNNTFFDDLYRDYRLERVYANRYVNSNAKKRGKISELLIRNY